MIVRKFENADLPAMTEIWNKVVTDGRAFPQENTLTIAEAEEFFSAQSFTGVVEDNGEIVGLYILHPNNVGRCGHISNASYAVKADKQNCGIGNALVSHCIKTAVEIGFRILQFNAVVKSNLPAIHLYEKLGFKRLGVIPQGYRNINGEYEDIISFYYVLK